MSYNFEYGATSYCVPKLSARVYLKVLSQKIHNQKYTYFFEVLQV